VINYNFKVNWLKILNFNANAEILGSFKDIDEEIRIPLTPIKIKASILYYFFEIFYPRFLNDQPNIYDVIYSEDKKSLIALYLYETRKISIHLPYKKIPKDIIIFQENDFNNINNLFNKLQMTIFEKYNVNISTIRFFSKKFIDLINDHCVDIERISIYEFINRFLNLIQQIFEENLFFIYPTPNAYIFIKDLLSLFENIRISHIFKFVDNLIPPFNLGLIFHDPNLNLLFQIQKSISRTYIPKININIKQVKDFFSEGNLQYQLEKFNKLKTELNVDNIIYFQMNRILSLLSNFLDLKIPLTKENFKLITQKLIYGYRNFESNWMMYPIPKAYNTVIRFLLRLFGINLNLKKISHWTIPEIFYNSFISYIGLNAQVLIIITDILKNRRFKLKNGNYLKKACKTVILLIFKNGILIKIKQIPKSIIDESDENDLSSIRLKVSEELGYISAIFNIDESFLKKLISNFIFELNKFNPLKKIKAYRGIKKDYNFKMDPPLPPYKLIKEKGVLFLFKNILPVLIDKHEF